MPVIAFVPAITFVWPPRPKPAPKRKPAKKRKPKPKRGAGRLSPQVRSLLIDRVELAVESGAVDLLDDPEHCDTVAITSGEYALLMRILFPEEFLEPKPPKGATRTAPGSAARIAEYQSRHESGRGLYAPGDAQPGLVAGRGLKVVSRANGSGHKVVGWADEEE